MTPFQAIQKRVEETYEVWLKERFPDKRHRALVRFVHDAVNAQRLHLLVQGRTMTDDELRRWAIGEYDVSLGC